jgi:hypothetical protein
LTVLNELSNLDSITDTRAFAIRIQQHNGGITVIDARYHHEALSSFVNETSL